jgi:hypothetical protein
MIRIRTLRNAAMLADAPPLGVQPDGRIATVNPQSRDKRRLLWIAAFSSLGRSEPSFPNRRCNGGGNHDRSLADLQ